MLYLIMGQLTCERIYSCDDDCERIGCPKHTATLKFNSIANVYTFDDGQGHKISMGIGLVEKLLEMFKHYSDTRADTADMP